MSDIKPIFVNLPQTLINAETETRRLDNLSTILDIQYGVEGEVDVVEIPEPCPRFLMAEITGTRLTHGELHPSFAACARAIDISETACVDRTVVWDLDHLHLYGIDRRTLGFNFLENEGEGHDPMPDAQRVSVVPASLSSFSPGISSDRTFEDYWKENEPFGASPKEVAELAWKAAQGYPLHLLPSSANL